MSRAGGETVLEDFVVVVIAIAAVIAVALVLIIVFHTTAFRRAREFFRTRYSLGEFILLVLVTGLAIGLTAKVLPADWPLAAVMPFALAVGVIAWFCCMSGLHAANRLGVERPRRRVRFIGYGFLYGAGFFFAALSLLLFFFLLHIFSTLKLLDAPGIIILCFLFLLPCALIFTLGRALLRDLRAERRKKRAAVPKDPLAGEPPEVPHSDPLPEGEGDDAADREA